MTQRTARWISILGHPFVTIPVLITAAGLRFHQLGATLNSLALVGVFILLPVAVLTFVQVRRKRWENVDASNAVERPILYAVMVLGLLGMWGYIHLTAPQTFLGRGLLGILILMVTAAVLNRWVKVSLHVGFATFAGVALLSIRSPVGWVLVALIPILARSRLRLNRHRFFELLLGALIGAASGLVTAFL